MMRRAAALLLLPLLMARPAAAEKLHALAMHGAPLYPPRFTHLDYANPDAPKGGALKVGKRGTFDSLNAHIVLGNVPDEGLELINDKLMQRAWNEPFTLYGLVAQSVEVAPDRSWIIFHLNPAARFHDGAPMTSEDVKFSFDAYRAHGHPVRRRVYGLVTDVSILSPQDIKFTFGPGYDRESVMILALMPVLPKHYWDKSDISKTTLEPPLGSGPYKITSAEPGRKIVYERVLDYWAKDLPINIGQYNFDTITYTFYRDDDIALQAFASGADNFRRENNVQKWTTAYDSPAVRAGRVAQSEIPHHRPEPLRALVFNTRRPAFADPRVREALGLMLDFDWINKSLFHGAFRRSASIFPNSELAAEPSAPEAEAPRARQRRAVALLKAAGWTYRDGQLVQAKTGTPFAFEILLGDPAEEKVALEFSRSLKKIGVAARVRTVDSAQFVGRLDVFDYDMVSYKWISSLSPGNEQLNYWGRAAADTRGSRNYAGVRSDAIDALARAIALAPDRETLVAKARALDRAVMAGHYFVPLYYLGRDLVVHDARIRHPQKIPVYGIVMDTLWFEP